MLKPLDLRLEWRKITRRKTPWRKLGMAEALDYVKLNVDAGFNIDMLQATAGAVMRNSKGHFIVAGN